MITICHRSYTHVFRRLPFTSSHSLLVLSIRRIATNTAERSGHAFYDDKIITYANRPIKPVTLKQLLCFGQPPLSQESLRACARYARTELPVRLARRVRAFQSLPFIVGTNPYIKQIYKLYYESFESLERYSHPTDDTNDIEYAEKLKELVERHSDNIPILARGFLECKQYMNGQDMATFLDDMIRARIGIRLIAEQCIMLMQPHDATDGHIGIIDTQLSPHKLIRTCADFVAELCEFNYGQSPETIVDGHIDTTFTYVPVHLEYILTELLKNSHRATIEYIKKSGQTEVPPIQVTISNGQEEIGIRIRDQGSGIKEEDLNKVFEYSYTTVSKAGDDEDPSSIFAGMAEMVMQSGVGGPLAGLGFGLPLARMYARYFGGSLTLVSMNGYGCDVFLKLKRIDESMAEDLEI
ncbi:branched-chain alpha-ketoacid dehydrogenase [Radiomyces spectabilis]|uniref:branched-chain alpha-ketoacid dehydrogenase n=1 Tax=Radiomyces spectabilis TaxID=64574 RepID=UPI00222096DD|nr:branched-chain alpha-ketoacid dehydrogenase [Radiomyces spectabilis]KAI8393263.1 branched-chain alpha-ketoacid dehydrogenase [Radiomyces spectabilis]